MLKPLSFKIPKNDEGYVKLQEDKAYKFYEFLHFHPEIQITLILEGKGELWLGPKRVNYEASDLIIIGSNDPHVFKSNSSDITLSHSISLFFNKEQIQKSLLAIPELNKLYNFVDEFSQGIVYRKINPAVIKIFKELFISNQIQKIGSFISLLENISNEPDKIILIPKAALIKSNENADQKLVKVYEYLVSHFDQEINLENVASIANMSIPAFCRYIKKRTRKTFTELVNDLRIAEAQKKLLNSDKPIAEIAFEVGFNNLSNFNRRFKKITGKTPGIYRSLS